TSSTCAPSASAARSAAFSRISALPCGWPQPSPSTVPFTGIIESLPRLASSLYGSYYLTVRTQGSRGRLDGKRALISGTGGGIGRATALLCAREGDHVVGCDLHPKSSEETVGLVRAGGGRLVEAAADLAGGIDILVNNASAIRFGPIGELSFADWSFTIRNELDIVFLVTRAAWPHLVAAGGGSIVNVASITASRGAFFMPQNAHGAAKGGVLALTYQLVVEGGPHGIRVNAVSPAMTETPQTA